MGELPPFSPIDLTGTQYQLGKYIKHTVPTSSYDFNTVFTQPGSATYFNFIVSAAASGHLEIDDRSRKNLVWVASAQTGFAYQHGSLVGPTDAVKVVFTYDKQKMHEYPIHSSELQNGICERRGQPVVL